MSPDYEAVRLRDCDLVKGSGFDELFSSPAIRERQPSMRALRMGARAGEVLMTGKYGESSRVFRLLPLDERLHRSVKDPSASELYIQEGR